MKREEKTGLSEAIKHHYRTERLKIQLPMAVADRVFGKKPSATGDIWLYALAVLCGLAILAICVLALPQRLFSPELIGAGLSIAAFFWLSYKEILIWSGGENFQKIK